MTKTVRHKIAAEIFGRHIDKFKDKNLVDLIKKEGFISPHTGLVFSKISRLISYPLAIDSVYWNDEPVIIDPNRFLYRDVIFTEVAKVFLNGTENILKISEVRLKNVGSIDFVLLRHKKLATTIEDFVLMEIQADSTTGTGKLVENLKDLVEKGYSGMKNSYNFGMNTYNTIKLSFIQMLMKGRVAESWKKHNVWIMQDFVFKNMLKRFELKLNDFTKEKFVHYFIYSLEMDKKDGELKLRLSSKHSYTTNELREAFNEDRSLSSLEEFMKELETKVKLKISQQRS